MIKQIDRKNKIFYSNDFNKDKYLYSEILNKDIQIFSDEENYILFYENNNIWIWTKDNNSTIFKWFNKINTKIINEIKEIIYQYLNFEKNCNLICKEKLYKTLLYDDNISFNLDDYIEKYFYICKDLIKQKECDGYIYIPFTNIYDINIISKYYYDNCKKDKVLVNYEQIKKYIYTLITQKKLYAWKNNQNEIVSLIIMSENEDYAVISNIFTPPDYRNCGYSSNLLYSISQTVINVNKQPIVLSLDQYDDFFKKVGFIKGDMLVGSSCSLENVKRR